MKAAISSQGDEHVHVECTEDVMFAQINKGMIINFTACSTMWHKHNSNISCLAEWKLNSFDVKSDLNNSLHRKQHS